MDKEQKATLYVKTPFGTYKGVGYGYEELKTKINYIIENIHETHTLTIKDCNGSIIYIMYETLKNSIITIVKNDE